MVNVRAQRTYNNIYMYQYSAFNPIEDNQIDNQTALIDNDNDKNKLRNVWIQIKTAVHSAWSAFVTKIRTPTSMPLNTKYNTFN